MLILDKKIVRPEDVEMSPTLLRWVICEHGKEMSRGGMEKLPKSQKMFLLLDKPAVRKGGGGRIC